MSVHSRRRTGASLLVVALLLLGAFVRVHPAAAVAPDTIMDPQDAPNGLDIQQATRVTNVSDNTETLTITDYAPFTDQQLTFFAVLIDTTSSGPADYWVILEYDPARQAIITGVGPAGSFHLTGASESRPSPSSVSVTFPLSAIKGSVNFNWSILSVAPPFSAGGPPIIDLAPDLPTTFIDDPVRIAGPTRIDTAVQSSFFPDGQADAVVLARSDAYPDALGGAALAAAKNAPLLLTSPGSLDPATLAEIRRVLPSNGTVYLLGGLSALSQSVEDALKTAGFVTVRFAGADRYETSLQIVETGLGNPATIFLTTGANFPDALSAGAAAANKDAGILLTNDGQLPDSIKAYLQANATDTVYAIGGPAASADPTATPVVGSDRYDTAAKVAQTFFAGPDSVGIASGTNYPDALAGGATMGGNGGPLLLSDPATLSPPTAAYLTANKANVVFSFVFGGPNAVSDGVRAAVAQALG
jgi:putative cell wall-binding protein